MLKNETEIRTKINTSIIKLANTLEAFEDAPIKFRTTSKEIAEFIKKIMLQSVYINSEYITILKNKNPEIYIIIGLVYNPYMLIDEGDYPDNYYGE